MDNARVAGGGDRFLLIEPGRHRLSHRLNRLSVSPSQLETVRERQAEQRGHGRQAECLFQVRCPVPLLEQKAEGTKPTAFI